LACRSWTAFRTLLIIEYNGRDYTLRKKSAWRSAFVVLDESDDEIGSLGRKSMWGREAAAVLPDEWPVAVRAFAIWRTLAMWKRESDGAVAAAAT
jgi:hypothetical protein